jgi:hypothetical protein
MSSYVIDHIEEVNGEPIGIVYIEDDETPMMVEYGPNGECAITLNTSEESESTESESSESESSESEQSEDEDGQYGGGNGAEYVMETTRERHIAKFNVRGYEYKVRIPRLSHVEYLEAVVLLHRTMDGEYFLSFRV